GRGFDEQLHLLDASAPEADAPRVALLKASLDAFVSARAIDGPVPPAQADADRLAAFGYLQGLRLPLSPLLPLSAVDQAALWRSHQQAAMLIASRRFAA